MQVRIRQTGGIAGPIELGPVDTALLGSRGRKIEALVAALQQSAASRDGEVIGADIPRYEITIVDGGRSRILEEGDEGHDGDIVRALVAAVGDLEPTSP